MRVLLLNQYGPKTDAPTGRILGELADGLRAQGHDVLFKTVDSTYGGPRRFRLLHEILAHSRLAWSSAILTKVDAVISFTSPACLIVTAALIARRHRAAHFHWAMDLYPELGVALKELPDGRIARLLANLVSRAYRNATCVVALDDDMRDHLRRRYGVEAQVVEPFPPEVDWPAAPEPRDGMKRWLYSGNLGRAHEIDALLRVQQRLEANGADAELVLRGQGAQWHSSQRAANELKLRRVRWEPPVRASLLGESLLRADVLVVTRKASLVGFLLPSKLLLAELSGRPILWIGDTASHTAWRLRKEGHGVFGEANPEAIAEWLMQIFSQSQTRAPQATSGMRGNCLVAWSTLLRAVPA
jgi:hypothetical protein